MNVDNRKILAQIGVLATIVLSLTCCVAGTLLTSETFFPFIDEEGPRVNGQQVPPELVKPIAGSNIFLMINCIIALLLLGFLVWFLFDKQRRKKIIPISTAAFLVYAGIYAGLWGLQVGITAVLTDGLLGSGEQLGVVPALLLIPNCFIVAIILAGSGGIVWYNFGRTSTPSKLPSNQPSTEKETFLRDVTKIEDQGAIKETRQPVQARLKILFQSISADEKSDLIRTLLIKGWFNPPNLLSLEMLDLQAIDLSELDLSGFSLQKANLSGANLVGVNLSDANLTGTNLKGASIRKANLSRAIMIEANLENAKLHQSNLTGANLIGALLHDANFWKANFTAAILTKAQLQTAKTIRDAIFSGDFDENMPDL